MERVDEAIRKIELVFATQNQNKVNEVQSVAPEWIKIISLKDFGYENDLVEDYNTLEENANQKAEFVVKKFGKPCFSEDAGLEVEMLDGEPGVKSARYAGLDKFSVDNINLLLQKMNGFVNRKARFRAVIVFTDGVSTKSFEGVCEGNIGTEPRGKNGFGYDPVFIPNGYNFTFGELPPEIKQRISHRTVATKSFITWLEQNWMA